MSYNEYIIPFSGPGEPGEYRGTYISKESVSVYGSIYTPNILYTLPKGVLVTCFHVPMTIASITWIHIKYVDRNKEHTDGIIVEGNVKKEDFLSKLVKLSDKDSNEPEDGTRTINYVQNNNVTFTFLSDTWVKTTSQIDKSESVTLLAFDSNNAYINYNNTIGYVLKENIAKTIPGQSEEENKMDTILNAKIILVNKTTAEWASETTIPSKGTPCIEFTVDGKTKLKIGDGENVYGDLSYIADDLTVSSIITALGYTPVDNAKVGVAEGVASLDAAGKVPASQLPSFVDDVIEVNGIDAAPETGETDKIYVDTVTNKTYRWSGTSYVEISASDIVTASEKNGYIKINGTDVKVYEPVQADWNETDDTSTSFIKNKPVIPVVDSELSEISENAVQNKVVTAALNDKISKNDTLVLNCTL